MEILYEIIAFVILVAIILVTWVLLIDAILKRIKNAKNQNQGEENKTIVFNIVLTKEEEEEDSKS